MLRKRSDKRQSSYARHGKQPYRYSETFRKWKAAVMEGRTSEADRLSAEHKARYAPRHAA